MDETPVIDEAAWADWSIEESYEEELARMCTVVTELRQALTEALTCGAIWCMCDAHELLRRTEHDEWPR